LPSHDIMLSFTLLLIEKKRSICAAVKQPNVNLLHFAGKREYYACIGVREIQINITGAHSKLEVQESLNLSLNGL